MKFIFLGHACFQIDTGKEKLLLILSSPGMDLPKKLPAK